jgi:yersiniabactin nonribosomal peptide synthetase
VQTTNARHADHTEAAPAAELRLTVAEILDADPDSFDEHDDLIRQGLDSISIMRIAAMLRRHGIEVRFAELAERPTLHAWHELLEAAQPAREPAADGQAIVDESEPFDLATLQLAYWIGRGPEQSLGVGAHFYAELDGAGVEPERLERAVRALVERHGMLRARFLDDGRQQIAAAAAWPGLAVHDLRDAGAAAQAQQLEERRAALSHRRLAVEQGEVFDVQLSLLAGGRTRVHVDIEMLVADAQSFRILLADLAALYERPGDLLPPLSYSFPRYLAQRSQDRGASWERARAYWAERIADLPGPPQLPLAVDPQQLEAPRAARRFTWLSGADAERLSARAREHGVTPSIVFATAFAQVVGAWSATPRFLLNLPFYDREPLHDDVERLVGDFTNVVLLEVDVSREDSFAGAARRLQEQLRRDARHAEYTGLDVLREVARAGSSEQAAAPVVFTSALSLGELFDTRVRRAFGAPAFTMSQTPGVWLDCQVTEREGGLYVNWDAVEELFCEGVLGAMFGAFEWLLGWLADVGSEWSGRVPGLLPESQRVVRVGVNGVVGPGPGRGLHEGFFARARERGECPAVLSADGVVSYAGLSERALVVAGWLRGAGLGVGESVVVTLPRGPGQVVAVLGVLAAGGVYVPVGVEQPVARRERIAVGAGARFVVDAVMLARAEAEGVGLDGPVVVDPGGLAYVIYTSGSTGEPKGVMVSHRAALNTVDAINARFGVGVGDRCLALSALDFDLSVYDVFGLLDRGGAIVIPDQDERQEPRHWLELMRRYRPTIWNTVPALLDMLLVAAQDDDGEPLQALRVALASGDWVGLDLPARLRAVAPECRFAALGGATEAGIWSNLIEVDTVPAGWRSIPYGFPLPNQRFRVVDAGGRDCPDWVSGELWIGGASVAEGYRGDPERSARQFVEHAGTRWYRTGDLGRYWPDGTLEFLGRTDHQIKLRGHRIELGEIESTLESHADVTRAVVMLAGRPAARLVACVVGAGRELDLGSLRALLAGQLPAYMIPDDVHVLDALPLTANGKIDRAALDRLASDGVERSDVAPSGPLEREIADLFGELLAAEHVSRSDSFFALGGDSLMATRAVEALRRRFGVELSLRQLFGAPTVQALALAIDAQRVPDAEEGEI